MEDNFTFFAAALDAVSDADASQNPAEEVAAEIASDNADFFFAQTVPEQQEQDSLPLVTAPTSATIQQGHRGRPAGTFGSKLLRASLRKRSEGKPLLSSASTPGTIEYARECKKRKQEDSSATAVVEFKAASTENNILSLTSSLWACMRDLGSPLQVAINMAAAHSMAKQPDSCRETSDCAEVLSMKSSALMSDAAVRASLVKAGKQDIADIGRATVIGTSAAILAGGLLWSGMLQALWDKLQDGWRGILLIQKLRHDETPMRIRLAEDGSVARKDQEVALHGKVLQFEASIHALVQDEQTGKMLLLSGKVPAMLQTVDRMTAECLVAAIDRVQDVIPDFERFTSAFAHCSRIAVP